MTPTWHPSPNFGNRRNGLRPELVVLHYTGMDSCAAALARLCAPAHEVSVHYLIDERGQVWWMVSEKHRAWHAGAGSWAGLDDINSRSIGIELANTGAHPFPDPQMRRLEALLGEIMARWNIPVHGVIGHSDMAPERKDDPGPRFDWARLGRAGLALWPDGAGDPQMPLARSLGEIGYPNCDPEKRLQAFRFRFRPWGHGAEGPDDRARADSVAAAFRAARG